MGYSAYAYTVYGKKVKRSDLINLFQVRGCDHNIDINQKFCSECGKPVFKIKEQEIETLDFFPTDGRLGKYYSDYESQYLIIGFSLAETNSESWGEDAFIPIGNITEKMKEELKEFFLTHKIEFDEKDFASYTFVHHSY